MTNGQDTDIAKEGAGTKQTDSQSEVLYYIARGDDFENEDLCNRILDADFKCYENEPYFITLCKPEGWKRTDQTFLRCATDRIHQRTQATGGFVVIGYRPKGPGPSTSPRSVDVSETSTEKTRSSSTERSSAYEPASRPGPDDEIVHVTCVYKSKENIYSSARLDAARKAASAARDDLGDTTIVPLDDQTVVSNTALEAAAEHAPIISSHGTIPTARRQRIGTNAIKIAHDAIKRWFESGETPTRLSILECDSDDKRDYYSKLGYEVTSRRTHQSALTENTAPAYTMVRMPDDFRDAEASR